MPTLLEVSLEVCFVELRIVVLACLILLIWAFSLSPSSNFLIPNVTIMNYLKKNSMFDIRDELQFDHALIRSIAHIKKL